MQQKNTMWLLTKWGKLFASRNSRKRQAPFLPKVHVQGRIGRSPLPGMEVNNRRKWFGRFFPKKKYQEVGNSGRGFQFRRYQKVSLLVLGFLVLCSGAAYFVGFVVGKIDDSLGHANFLQVEHLKITGNVVVSEKSIRQTAAIVEHKTGMLGIDLDKIKKDIESMPWIRMARVKRSWPATVLLEVEEEKAHALLLTEKEGKQQLQYMDDKGRLFLAARSGGKLDFPVITGLSDIADRQLRDKALADVLVLLARMKKNNPYLPTHSLSEIHLTSQGEMILYLVEYPFPIFFGKGNVKQKYWRLVQIMKPLYKNHKGRKRIESVSYIQMEYMDDKVRVATIDQ